MVGAVSRLRDNIRCFFQARNLRISLALAELIDGSIVRGLNKSSNFARMTRILE
jgi:hypothetical protein